MRIHNPEMFQNARICSLCLQPRLHDSWPSRATWILSTTFTSGHLLAERVRALSSRHIVLLIDRTDKTVLWKTKLPSGVHIFLLTLTYVLQNVGYRSWSLPLCTNYPVSTSVVLPHNYFWQNKVWPGFHSFFDFSGNSWRTFRIIISTIMKLSWRLSVYQLIM